MSKIKQLYRVLQSIDDPTVDRAMAAALPTADHLSKQLMGLLLLQRKQPQSLTALILEYHQLPADLQQNLIRHAADLFRPIREAAGMPHTQGPANAVTLIKQARQSRLAYLVAAQLRHGEPALQKQAAACLLELTQYAATDHRQNVLPQIDAHSTTFLLLAIEDALASYGAHHCPGVIEAAAWLWPRTMPNAMKLLADANHPASRATAELLHRADRPAVRRLLLRTLSIECLTRAAYAGLRSCAEHQQLGQVIAQHPMLLLPSVRNPISRLKNPQTLCPSEQATRAMLPHEQRGLAPWLAALTMEPAERIETLASLRTLEDSAARLFALRGLLDVTTELTQHAATPAPLLRAADDAVAGYANDTEPAIARVALRQLIRRHYTDLPRILAQLVNSPDEQLRNLANRRFASIGFARLWDAWPKLEHTRRRAAGAALLKLDPNFHCMLSDKLAADDRTSRVRAISIISTLNQASYFEQALAHLAETLDEVVASAAVKAMGAADSELAKQSLKKALDHADARVRANAVEAIAQHQSAEHVRTLVQMAEHDDNRPRANAIAALMQMKMDQALPALSRMLHDPNAAHRKSALWLVESLGLLDATRLVAEMSISDNDHDVRSKADRVVNELIHLINDPLAGETPSNTPAPAAHEIEGGSHDPH